MVWLLFGSEADDGITCALLAVWINSWLDNSSVARWEMMIANWNSQQRSLLWITGLVDGRALGMHTISLLHTHMYTHTQTHTHTHTHTHRWTPSYRHAYIHTVIPHAQYTHWGRLGDRQTDTHTYNSCFPKAYINELPECLILCEAPFQALIALAVVGTVDCV